MSGRPHAISLSIRNAIIAQLVEHWLPKPRVAGSSPVYRSRSIPAGAYQLICARLIILSATHSTPYPPHLHYYSTAHKKRPLITSSRFL